MLVKAIWSFQMQYYGGIYIIQAKTTDLDSRLTKVREDINLMNEKISVLNSNARKLHPEEVVKKYDTVR